MENDIGQVKTKLDEIAGMHAHEIRTNDYFNAVTQLANGGPISLHTANGDIPDTHKFAIKLGIILIENLP
jgi:hypothetical protein